MAVQRRPYYRTGDSSCPSREMGPNDCIYPSMIPDDSISEAKIQEDAVTADKIANDAVTRLKMANLSVGPRELISQAVDHANIGSDSIGIENLAIESGSTETLGHLLAIGPQESIADASQESNASTAFTFRVIDPADISTSVPLGSIGRDQLDFATGTTETDEQLVGLTANNQLTTFPRPSQTGGQTAQEVRDAIDTCLLYTSPSPRDS